MKVIYTKGWFRSQRRYLKEYEIDYTKDLYNNRKPFGIVIEEDNIPFCFVNFNNKFVYVGFLDNLKREYLGYEFWEEETGKIFLKEVQFWEYEGETDNKIKSTRYRFTPDGQFGIEERDNLTNEAIRKYAKEKIDTSILWEKYPVFGNYDEIIKIERELPKTQDKQIFLSEKDTSIYKTFKGKNYTQEEWEAFEKEQWERYNKK